MSISSFWEQDRLKFKRLPTLQDLLRVCDQEVFEEVVLCERGPHPDSLDERSRRVARKRIETALGAMRSLNVKAEAKANRQLVLLPEESFALHVPSLLIERRLAASLVSLEDDLPVALRAQNPSKGVENAREAEEVTHKGCVLSVDDGFWPPRRNFALASWEEVLAYRVWLGGPWCCRERYLVLSSVFWEMTYYGFEYNHAFAQRSQAQARALFANRDSDVSYQDASFSDGCVGQTGEADESGAFGLREPDRFELDYRDRLAWRVDSLNRDAWRLFCDLVIDVARRVGRM